MVSLFISTFAGRSTFSKKGLSRIETAFNTTKIQYFWGMDLSETLQGAGGVGGLLAVSINGLFYFPSYDNNGNVTKYIDESGNVVAAYEYDDFGRLISKSGPMADFLPPPV